MLILTLALLSTQGSMAQSPSVRTGMVIGGSGLLIMGLATPAEYKWGKKTPLVQQSNKFAAIVVGGGLVVIGGFSYIFETKSYRRHNRY